MERDMQPTEIREFTNPEIDKSKWGEGPWQNEPDKIHWIDPTTDLDCLMVRNYMGAWCGYVGLTEGHSLFGKQYDDADVNVHGGLTYADFCQETEDPAQGVCHVPFAGRPDHVWWLGFDCAHAMDMVPGLRSLVQNVLTTVLEKSYYGTEYRSRPYVEAEVTDLAQQLKALEGNGPHS